MKTIPTILVALSLHSSLVLAADAPSSPAPDGKPSAGAVILFDGKSLDLWQSENGKPAAWKVENGEMVITAGGGNLVSKAEFKAAHIHLEFNLPDDPKHFGNSGVYIHKLYEVQIIDSFNKNPYKPGQQCAALYQEFPADKNVCKKPGEWQTFDILFHGPKLDAAGKLTKPARFTIFHNGVCVHDNRELSTGTGGAKGKPLVENGPILLQNHGGLVRFRNIWIKELP